MKIKKKKIIPLFFAIVLVTVLSGFINSADYVLQYDGSNINYGVVGKTFEIMLSNPNEYNLFVDFNDTLELINRSMGMDTYSWTLSTMAGTRTFTLSNGTCNETFQIQGLSEVEELFNHVGEIQITIKQDESNFSIEDLDLKGATNEYIEFNFDEFSGRKSIQSILDGIELDFTFEEGKSYPTYNYLGLSGQARDILGSIIQFNQDHLSYDSTDDVLNNPTLLNELIDLYDLVYNYSRTTRIIKSGNDYYVYVNEGYTNLGGSTLETIKEKIEEGINFVNPSEVIEYLSPYYNFSEYLNDITWDTYVDISSIELIDGTYDISLTLTDAHGNNYTTVIPVTLDIKNVEEGIANEGVYIPTEEEIVEYVQEIFGLPENTTVAIVVYGSNLPEEFEASEAPTEVETPVNFIEINISTNSTNQSGEYRVNFTVSSEYNKDLVQAYVYENSSWTELPTYYVRTSGDKHYFYFTTSHFSQFMIGVKKARVTPTRGGGTCITYWICTEWSECINGIRTRNCTKARKNCQTLTPKPQEVMRCIANKSLPTYTPLPLTNQQPRRKTPKGFFGVLTGAVIGALNSQITLLTISFILLILIALLLIKIGRITSRKKKSKKAIQTTNG